VSETSWLEIGVWCVDCEGGLSQNTLHVISVITSSDRMMS